jgi:surface antigen
MFQGNLKGVVVQQASLQLFKCTAASNKECNVEASSGAVVSLTGCTVTDCLEGNGLKALFNGTHVKAKETMIQRNLKGVVVEKRASVQLDKCTAASNKDSNVEALCGGIVELTGCTVSDCLQGKGLDAKDKGSRVVAKETKFQGNYNGVIVSEEASMQLDKCIVTSNKDSNVKVLYRAVVSLTGCTVQDCLEGNGLEANEKGTRVEAKDTMFQGNLKGVVVQQASLQLFKCTAASNKECNVEASSGAVVSLTGCTVADCLKGNGLDAKDPGTCVEAKETTFQGKLMCCILVKSKASVNVEHCTFQDMKLCEVANKGGLVVIDGRKIERMSLMSRIKLASNLK